MARMQKQIRILGKNNFRSGSISRRFLFIWFMIAGTILYMVPHSTSNKLQLAFAHVFRLPLSVGASTQLAAYTQQKHNDTVPRAEYETLLNEFENLKQILIRQREQFDELDRLNNSFINEDVAFIQGEIIQAKDNPSPSELTIQCRSTKGLAEGQFVLAGNYSVLGVITNVWPQIKKATVKLITAQDSKIAVNIDGLNRKLTMQGNGDDTAKIDTLPQKEDFRIGANVFALDQGGFLDAPILIGKVSKRKPDDENPLLWDITVKPAWDFDNLDNVSIIIMNPPK